MTEAGREGISIVRVVMVFGREFDRCDTRGTMSEYDKTRSDHFDILISKINYLFR